MSVVIQGFSDTDKVPGFVGETKLDASPITLASIPLILLLVGLKTSGTMVADQDVLDVQSGDDASVAAGPGSELHRMVLRAIKVPSVRIKIACPTAAGSAAAATATITIAGSWTAAGQWTYRIAGETITGGTTAADTATTVAAAIAAKANANPALAASASPSSGVVTLSWKTPGVRGNEGIIFQDVTQLASGMTSTLAGGSAVTGGGKHFSGGSGTEDVTALLTVLLPSRYHRIAHAQNDATNLARWKVQLDTKAGPLEGRMEHSVFSSTGTLSAAGTLSTSTCNNGRMQQCWLLNSESHSSEISARMAAQRVATEQTQPNSSYDGVALTGIAAQTQRLDWPQRVTQQAALDEGVTPLTTTEDGNVVVVRAITTYSLNGSNPDYNVLDVADSVVPDYVRDYDKLVWTTQFLPANPYVRSDPAPSEPEVPQGVATPTRWNQQLGTNGFALEASKILTGTALQPPYSEYDAAAKRIMSIHPAPRLPHQHSIGVSVRQVQAA